MLYLTPHFTLEELGQPEGLGVPAQDYPVDWVADRAVPLCQQLEVLRQELGGHPITVISGYRSQAYNEARRRAGHDVAEHSQHIEGRAADVVVAGVPAAEVHAAALRLALTGKMHLGGLGQYDEFTHIDVRPGELVRWDNRTHRQG